MKEQLHDRIAGHTLTQVRKVLHTVPVDWQGAFLKGGIAPEVLKDESLNFRMENLLDVMQSVAEETGDEYFAVRHFDRDVMAFYPTLYGGLMSLSTNMKDFEDTYRRYHTMHTTGAYQFVFQEKAGFHEVDVSVLSQHPGAVHLVEFLLLYMNNAVAHLSGSPLRGLRLELMRRDVGDEMLYWRHFGRLEICCGMPKTVLYSDLEIYQRAFLKRDSYLMGIIRQNADAHMQLRRDEPVLVERLRALLTATIGDRPISADSAAEALGISRTGLFRHLKAARVSFQSVYDSVRHENAQRFLLESDLECWEIGDMLGFAQENNFRRFFKKMEGVTPGQYRKKYLRKF